MQTMKLEQYRTLWGQIDAADGQLARSPYHTVDEIIPELARLGYDGIEIPFKLMLFIGPDKLRTLLNQHGLKCTVMIFTDNVVVPGAGVLWGGPYKKPSTGELFTAPTPGGEPDKDKLVRTHLQVWKEQVEETYKLNLPLHLIVSHSCKDYFTFDMAEKFFTAALEFEKQGGYTVCHETHRKRFLYSPWVARDFLVKFPNMKICADLSHWINVAETDTMDKDLTQVILDVAPQVYHVHCRVGYDHGPQVPDPRAKEWLPYMEGHERWWDAIWAAQAKRGQKVSSMIAEHGPPNYQQTLPHSREPVAHIWDVNHWIHLRRQARFAELFPSGQNSKIKPSKSQGPEPLTTPGDVMAVVFDKEPLHKKQKIA